VASNIAGDNKVVNFGTGSKILFGFWFLATCDYQPKTRNQQPATYLLGSLTCPEKVEKCLHCGV